jgi:hypothetical protein
MWDVSDTYSLELGIYWIGYSDNLKKEAQDDDLPLYRIME